MISAQKFNRMKHGLLLTVVIFVLYSCNKGKNDIEIDREVETFSSASFKRYGPRLSVEDFILNEDGSLVVVGNGKQENSFLPQPFILTLDLQKEISWLKFFIDDRRNIYRRVSVIPALDENYVVLSYSDADNLPGFDADLSKVTPFGDFLWNTRIAEENKSLASSAIVELPDGDYVVYSRAYPVDSLESGFLQFNRISWSGALIWDSVIDEGKLVAARQMILFPESSCFIALSEHGHGLALGPGELRVHKFDFDGNVIWQETIVAAGSIWPQSSNISPVENENFVITFSSNTLTDDNRFDVTAIKMGQGGNREWEKTYAGQETEIPQTIIPTQDGKYILLANTSSFGNGHFDVMLSKIDADGTLLWDHVYGGPASDQGRKVVERNNGNLVLVGNTNEGNSSDAIFDLFVLETDPEGNPE